MGEKKNQGSYEIIENLSGGLSLIRDAQGLALTGFGMTVRGDFSKMKRRAAQPNLSGELIVRAGAFKSAVRPDGDTPPLAVDMTAGLGEDSFLLAAAGWNVHLYEHNPVIAALLADALARAEEDPETARITSRMTLRVADSVSAVRNGQGDGSFVCPDIIYLDPMFPARRKSGLVGKKLQLLQKLEAPCVSEEEVLNAAMAASPRRIIIKRPLKGSYLAGVKPQISLPGKAVRFDVILV